MTDCENYRELISRLADDQLNSSEYSALSAHMEDCPECRAEYAVFIELSKLIKEDLPELPEGLHENIMAGIRRSEIVKKNRRSLPRRTRYFVAAAACFGVVMLAAAGIAGELSGGMSRMSSRSAAATAGDVSRGSSTAAMSDLSIDEAGAANAAVYASMSSPDVYYAPDEYLADEPELYQTEQAPDPYLGPAPAALPEATPAAPAEQTEAPTVVPAPAPSPAVCEAPAPIQEAKETAPPVPTLPALDISEAVILPNALTAPAATGTPAPVATEQPDVPVRIDMTEGEHWNELMALLAGKTEQAESALTREKAEPRSERAEKVYTLTVTVDGVQRELTVYVYADAICYSIPEPLTDAGLYLAGCTAKDLEKLAMEHPAQEHAEELPAVAG